MNVRLNCSIYGTWCQKYCKFNAYGNDDPNVHPCEFRNCCTNLKTTLEKDINVSADMTKRVLIHGIPSIFNRGQPLC